MRILFMGTPDIAAESLAALLDAGHEVCGVFTRRDKPVGRKQILTAPPVKQLAVEHGLSVYQPRTLRDGSSDELIKELAPDIIVVVAYGCITVQGHGTFGPHDCEAAIMLRYGQMSADEFFVSEKAAQEGVVISNHSKVEPLVILKHFAPNNKEIPQKSPLWED